MWPDYFCRKTTGPRFCGRSGPWTRRIGDYYTKARTASKGGTYTYAGLAERIVYDAADGFRLACRSINAGGAGFYVRPKKHAAYRLTEQAAAVVGSKFAFCV